MDEKTKSAIGAFKADIQNVISRCKTPDPITSEIFIGSRAGGIEIKIHMWSPLGGQCSVLNELATNYVARIIRERVGEFVSRGFSDIAEALEKGDDQGVKEIIKSRYQELLQQSARLERHLETKRRAIAALNNGKEEADLHKIEEITDAEIIVTDAEIERAEEEILKTNAATAWNKDFLEAPREIELLFMRKSGAIEIGTVEKAYDYDGDGEDDLYIDHDGDRIELAKYRAWAKLNDASENESIRHLHSKKRELERRVPELKQLLEDVVETNAKKVEVSKEIEDIKALLDDEEKKEPEVPASQSQ